MKNKKKEVTLEFNLPEFNKRDIKVNLTKNLASIKAEKTTKKELKKKDYYHKEKTFRSFSYTTTLPTIESKKAKIVFKKGKLKIIAPKKQ